jgi:hypothetical protein
MPNVLPLKVRTKIVRALVEGNSVRSTSRLTHTDKDAVVKLGVTVGEGCKRLHDKFVRHLPAGTLEIDETWGFVGRHERRKLKSDPPWFGDQYHMFALDKDSKLVPSYKTGKRTLPVATVFMKDLRARVDGKPQVTVDGWPHWVEALRRSFGHNGVNAGMTVKEYQKACPPDGTARACGRVKSQTKSVIYGKPIQKFISTSRAERFNLTSRMTDRRLTRLTNAFSRKATNHAASADLHYFWYNFVRRHEAIGTTPAVKAGITDHEWTLAEMTKAALAEMGADTPERDPTLPRKYQRKTHTRDMDDPTPPPEIPRTPCAPTPRKRARKLAPPTGCTDDPATCPCSECATARASRDMVFPGEPTAEDNQEDAVDVPTAPVPSRGIVPLTVVAHVGLAVVGVLAVRTLDAVQIRAFGRDVPASGVALGATVAGGALAYGLGRRDIARGAAALAVGLGTGMLGREATRGWLAAAPAPAALSSGARDPLWKRALRWVVGPDARPPGRAT